MEFEKTYIEGLILVKPDVYNDSRGYFYESFNQNKYIKCGIDQTFVQDNISSSVKGTIRGLHYQAGENAQGKLCQVLLGRVLDVAVDIRFGSPTFGMHYSVELSDDNKYQLWIPKGFAHGFSVLSDRAIFYYKCTAIYSKNDERAILYNDSKLGIDWKVDNPLLSPKDTESKHFFEIDKDFFF